VDKIKVKELDWTNIALRSVIGFSVGFIVSTVSQIYLGATVSFWLWVILALACIVLYKIKPFS
jgi:uncharacterized membrane protein YgaE (UPF0421/DUF939 family)